MRFRQLLYCTFSCALLSDALAQNTISATLEHNGLTREYLLYVPAIYDGNAAVPLVFNLHGYTSNNSQQNFYADFKPIADTANFLLVLPNGTLDNGGNRYWNVGFFPSSVDDVGFLMHLLDTLQATYNIDAERVYSTGMSNGGFMSYELACQTDRIAAIASVTGSITPTSYADCQPTRPVPVMQIHGTSDNTVPYNGSALMQPIDTVVAYWVRHNQCQPIPTNTAIPNTVTTDGATATQFVYSGGADGATVELFKIDNGGHTWPGAPVVIGTTCMDFDASAEIWRFFSGYRRLSFTAPVVSTPSASTRPLLSPNPCYGQLRIEMDQPIDRIEIWDAQGRLIASPSPTADSVLSFDQLPNGLYFVRMHRNGESWTECVHLLR